MSWKRIARAHGYPLTYSDSVFVARHSLSEREADVMIAGLGASTTVGDGDDGGWLITPARDAQLCRDVCAKCR